MIERKVRDRDHKLLAKIFLKIKNKITDVNAGKKTKPK